jgi:hypothetical protein
LVTFMNSPCGYSAGFVSFMSCLRRDYRFTGVLNI